MPDDQPLFIATSTLSATTLSFVIPSEAEGSRVLGMTTGRAAFHWECCFEGRRPPHNVNITRAGFRLNRRAASVDRSAHVVFINDAMGSHGERGIRLHRSRTRLRIQREMSVAAQPQRNLARTRLELPGRSGLSADVE